MAFAIGALAILAPAAPRAAADESQFHVDGAYHLDLATSHGSEVRALAEGYLYLANDPDNPLHFTLDTLSRAPATRSREHPRWCSTTAVR
jgi:hypothetical protein